MHFVKSRFIGFIVQDLIAKYNRYYNIPSK